MAENVATHSLVIGDERLEIPTVLPVLPVRDAVVFPGMSVPLAIGRARSLAALDAAGSGGFLVVATQRDPQTEDPQLEDLFPIACITRVVRVVDARREGKQAIVVGLLRARLVAVESEDPAFRVRIEPIPDVALPTAELDTARERVLELAKKVIDLRDDIPDEWKQGLESLGAPGLLADLIASYVRLPGDERVKLLQEPSPVARLWRLVPHLDREVTIAEAQKHLAGDETESVDPEQRERILRRRARDIEHEIGEGDSGQREVDELRDKVDAAKLPADAREQADRELRRLRALPSHAPDRHLIRTYLEWLADLPWSIETTDLLDLAAAREVLDADHHDLEKVKDRILEFLAVRKLAPDAKAPILCFVGPPGVGKTSLGRSIARAMGRNFTRASLGGVRDEAEIRGHRRTYVGAMPGRIVQSLRRSGSRNAVFLLDEIDKLGADFRGDPSSALLEVLDPEQNSTFSDHYLEVPFDLSKVLFIATANTLATIPPALLDRMEVIELPGYTDRDKLAIARRHLVPKQVEAHGLRADQVSLSDAAIERVVHEYTREAGVRNLERHFATLFRKAAARIAAGRASGDEPAAVAIDPDFVAEALGAPPHLPESAERTTVPGVVVGLAATAHGGDILFIEATAVAGGEGVRLRLTGQLGDVMRESAEAALSWVRANADRYEISAEALRAGEIHLHVPKDGPSAGVALATAILSALSGRRALGTAAMTGEISLRGRVLPVGGIKEKVLAASRAGIERIILPGRNRKDVIEVPEEVREKLDFRFVEVVDEAIAAALEPAPRGPV
ncbi:MAG TPA: endopeptidase La, partial [Myxococcota bacterium]|nr:endopeptidase La [Myxococcota bacterium]